MNSSIDPSTIVERTQQLSAQVQSACSEVGKVIMGADAVIADTVTALLSGGHVLLVGVPGLGKTRLVETLGTVFGLDESRIQCTPDLMPADILGSEVLEESAKGKRLFRFVPGPIFSQLLMSDEINRASPRTQSALLQAMQENKVSVAGVNHDLPTPFHVLATQNPIEQEGTYPLPEAQLDRFMMQVNLGYPDLDAERQMVIETTRSTPPNAEQVMSAAQLVQAQELIRHVPVGERVLDAILQLVRSGRPETSSLESVRRYVHWGPGPRASQSLMLAVRARSVLQGRLSPDLNDVRALAASVLQHRMALHFSARADGVEIENIIQQLCDEIE